MNSPGIDTAPLIISPNTVLANAMVRTVDMLRPHVEATRPRQVALCVGTQINGVPHLGTALVQATAFLLAKAVQESFDVRAVVRFSALDNAPFRIRRDPGSEHDYQQTYYHALGEARIADLIGTHYLPYFDALAHVTGTRYETETYTRQQASSDFRHEFLATLGHLGSIRWTLAPSHGQVHLRLPCPHCGWAEKHADRTRLIAATPVGAEFTAVCLDHGEYKTTVTPCSGGYLDLSTLYRNLVKERLAARDRRTLSVMVKGGDWAFGCQLVDASAACLPTVPVPPRVFAPMVLTDTGAKLSKSLIRDGLMQPPPGAAPWMLDITAWEGDSRSLATAMVWLVDSMISDPKHFYRSYTTMELHRLMTSRADQPARERDMNLYRQYFDLIAAGRKTVEVRVRYPSLESLAAGDRIRFRCDADECLTQVRRVTRYPTFDAMMSAEDPASINPDLSPARQLAGIRDIYGPEKEALGVLAIEVERVPGAHDRTRS